MPLDTRTFYAHAGAAYREETFGERMTVASIARTWRTTACLHLLHKHLGRRSRIVDIGCGPAQFAAPLTEAGHRYLGIDIVTDMFQKVSSALRRDQASFLLGKIEGLPLPSSRTDAVLSIGVLEYVDEPWRAFREIARILKPGGLAVLSFPNLLNPIHALRTVIRPALAPVVRTLRPEWNKTVYVSGITHRPFLPDRFLRLARDFRLSLIDTHSHGYFPGLFNHGLSPAAVTLHQGLERMGQRLAPGFGSNCIVCLRKG